jgi:hypothetical protein
VGQGIWQVVRRRKGEKPITLSRRYTKPTKAIKDIYKMIKNEREGGWAI